MDLDNLKEEEKKAIEMTRVAAGLETVVRKTEEVELIGETLEEKKDRLNEVELERIKKVKLSPGVSFSIWLIDWEDRLKEVIVKFPKTSQAMKYNNLTMNPNNSKIEIGFSEILENFKNDGLLNNFDVDNFPLSEVSELAGFLMRVIQNPKFK
jgi:hypothetical protein|nr:MAG TPA: hypothetical protein [Caudoviricetes sp.]